MNKSILFRLARAQLHVGCLGFGGPLATMSMMRELLVEREKLVHPDRYLEGLGAVKLLPGPVSSMLSVYLGLEIAGTLGGLLSIICFVSPSFLMLLAICYGERWVGPEVLHSRAFTSSMHALQISVLAVILQNCWKLFRDSQLRPYTGIRRPIFTTLSAIGAAGLLAAGQAEIKILLLSALLGASWVKLRNGDFSPFQKLKVEPVTIFVTFFQAGLTVFGTGYMVLPYLQRLLVTENGWISPESFLDAVAYGNLTPGPVVIASTYMGFKMNGLGGSLAATLGIFIGPVILILIVGPFIKRIMGRPWVEGALCGLLPAVAGTIFVGTLMLAREISWTSPSYVIFLAAAIAIFRGVKAPWVLLTAGIVGLGLSLV